ncbi:MAG: pantoate--beta-alanine ligase [Actinomycetota bacterium]
MRIAATRAELADSLEALPGTRALVMTMGALHEGHLTLVRRAGELADHVLVSVYVNPLQFGPEEDFDAYPRDLAADLALLEPEGVALVFAPTDADMYPRQPLVRIDPGPVGSVLEGAMRPGHFAGVLQVVHKVLCLTRPDVALFGRKDAQQLALVTTMVEDLDVPVRIVPVGIVRDDDGVARSSRNAHLSTGERVRARALVHALRAGVVAAGEGPDAALAAAREVLDDAEGVELDYLVIVDPATFTDLEPGAATGLLAVAARVGTTRLIDNALVPFGGTP